MKIILNTVSEMWFCSGHNVLEASSATWLRAAGGGDWHRRFFLYFCI